MDQSRWDEIQTTFDALVELDTTTRARRLATLGVADPALRAAVESLLAADAQVDARLAHLEPIGAGAKGVASRFAAALTRRSMERHATDLDGLFVAFQTALLGRYSLDREIGRGGMGIVYLAREVRLDRPVAIKLLPPNSAVSHVTRERFLREARTAARLSHPNIVPIYSVDEVGEFVFYAMAYVSGQTLAQRVRTGGPLRPDDGARVLREVAWALDYAHSLGIVHRDVKPENIMLESPTGRVLVTDFGIAQVADAETLTEEGTFVGTPGFMSPEQARGQSVDARSDVYSLGVVGYYVLSGHLPFESATASALLVRQTAKLPPAVSLAAAGVPRKLERAITRSLAEEPEDRYTNAAAFADALLPMLQQSRELPAPLRAFLERPSLITRLLKVGLLAAFLPEVVWSGLGALWGFEALGTMERGILHEGSSQSLSTISQLSRWSVVVLFGIGLFVIACVDFNRLRRLLRLGYAHPDLVLAVKRDTERRRDEWNSAHPGFPPVLHDILHITWIGVLGIFLVSLVKRLLLMPPPYAGIPSPWWIGVAFFAVGGILGAPMITRASVLSGSRLRFWGGRFGRWLFKLAGLGVQRSMASEGASHRPTEFGLAVAIAVLYEGLPKEPRVVLNDLPAVVEQLEADARLGRVRIDELGELIAEAGEQSYRESGEKGRLRLVDDLRAAQEDVERRFGQIISALETIRLDLVRLRAGVGNIEGVTADLAAARSIGERISRALEGQREVELMLADRGPHADRTTASARGRSHPSPAGDAGSGGGVGGLPPKETSARSHGRGETTR